MIPHEAFEKNEGRWERAFDGKRLRRWQLHSQVKENNNFRMTHVAWDTKKKWSKLAQESSWSGRLVWKECVSRASKLHFKDREWRTKTRIMREILDLRSDKLRREDISGEERSWSAAVFQKTFKRSPRMSEKMSLWWHPWCCLWTSGQTQVKEESPSSCQTTSAQPSLFFFSSLLLLVLVRRRTRRRRSQVRSLLLSSSSYRLMSP